MEYVDQDSDEDDDEKIYNPLKLPLGWDGKPIPYWLYKLHGLGVEYPCEICGNYVYMGRKAFDKHFQEWRHAQGMRSLGIPNTRQFHEITKIDDVLACKFIFVCDTIMLDINFFFKKIYINSISKAKKGR